MGLAQRLAWHVRLAWRASRLAVLVAGLVSVAFGYALPVQDGWMAAAVAGVAALLALALLAVGTRAAPPPPAVRDVAAALERAGSADLWAHILARSAMVLAAAALGLSLGGAADALQ